ncbi:MAG: hypothetical protein IJ079_06795 [Lachnospiraceae bacterium]|nr:hypothetical protein [Lachnospiraceae bacterium]
MQTEQYQEYIRSEEWKSKAAERIALDQMCVMSLMNGWGMKIFIQTYVLCAVVVM